MDAPHAAALTALTLPRLDRVPARAKIDEGAEAVQQMARALTHAGVLQGHHLDHAKADLRAAMDAAVHEWLAPFEEPLQIFDGLNYGYTDRLDLETYEDEWLTKKKPAAFVVSCDRERECFYIDRTALALEKTQPGLGRNLLILLQQAATHGFGLFTPSCGRGAAEYCFWRGEADETEVAKEHLCEGDMSYEEFEKLPATVQAEKIAQICELNDIPTRASLDAVTPPWATELPRCCYWPGEVPSFPALRGRLRPVMEAANALAAHLRTVRSAWLSEGRGEASDPRQPNDRLLFRATTDVSAPALLRWSYQDPLPRLLDDLYQDAMNSGDVDVCLTAIVCFDPRDAEDCRDARRRFEALLQTAALTDQLVRLSTYPDDSN